jgi:hypothetical protein
MSAVVSARAIQLNGQLNTSTSLELVRVDSWQQTSRDTRPQDLLSLVEVESATIAKHINPLGIWRCGEHHLVADQMHIVVWVVCEFGGHNMSPKECAFGGELRVQANRASFVGD